MKYFLFILLLLMPALFAEQSLVQETISGKKVTLIRVVLDGRHKITTSISHDGESLASLVQKSGGVSGINGAYFCPADYADCEGKNSTNADRIWEGDGKTYSRYWPDTGSRGIFGFDQQGDFLFVRNNLGFSGGVTGKFHEEELNNIWYGIGNYPILLQEGVNMIPSYEKAGLIDSKMRTSGIKNMICITEDEKTVYMGNISDITIDEMPDFLKNNLGCSYALNLDAGGSLGMRYNGINVRTPGRNIMDAFVVVEVDFTESDVANAGALASKGIIQGRSTIQEYELHRNVFRQEMIAMALKVVGVAHPEKAITLPETYSCQNVFADVSYSRPNTWACRSVEIAAQAGLVTSKNEFFRPEDSVSRAEAIAIILTATGNRPTAPIGQPWEITIMQYAFDHGIISSLHLSTATPLTRKEVFEIIVKSLENARETL